MSEELEDLITEGEKVLKIRNRGFEVDRERMLEKLAVKRTTENQTAYIRDLLDFAAMNNAGSVEIMAHPRSFEIRIDGAGPTSSEMEKILALVYAQAQVGDKRLSRIISLPRGIAATLGDKNLDYVIIESRGEGDEAGFARKLNGFKKKKEKRRLFAKKKKNKDQQFENEEMRNDEVMKSTLKGPGCRFRIQRKKPVYRKDRFDKTNGFERVVAFCAEMPDYMRCSLEKDYIKGMNIFSDVQVFLNGKKINKKEKLTNFSHMRVFKRPHLEGYIGLSRERFTKKRHDGTIRLVRNGIEAQHINPEDFHTRRRYRAINKALLNMGLEASLNSDLFNTDLSGQQIITDDDFERVLRAAGEEVFRMYDELFTQYNNQLARHYEHLVWQEQGVALNEAEFMPHFYSPVCQESSFSVFGQKGPVRNQLEEDRLSLIHFLSQNVTKSELAAGDPDINPLVGYANETPLFTRVVTEHQKDMLKYKKHIGLFDKKTRVRKELVTIKDIVQAYEEGKNVQLVQGLTKDHGEAGTFSLYCSTGIERDFLKYLLHNIPLSEEVLQKRIKSDEEARERAERLLFYAGRLDKNDHYQFQGSRKASERELRKLYRVRTNSIVKKVVRATGIAGTTLVGATLAAPFVLGGASAFGLEGIVVLGLGAVGSGLVSLGLKKADEQTRFFSPKDGRPGLLPDTYRKLEDKLFEWNDRASVAASKAVAPVTDKCSPAFDFVDQYFWTPMKIRGTVLGQKALGLTKTSAIYATKGVVLAGKVAGAGALVAGGAIGGVAALAGIGVYKAVLKPAGKGFAAAGDFIVKDVYKTGRDLKKIAKGGFNLLGKCVYYSLDGAYIALTSARDHYLRTSFGQSTSDTVGEFFQRRKAKFDAKKRERLKNKELKKQLATPQMAQDAYALFEVIDQVFVDNQNYLERTLRGDSRGKNETQEFHEYFVVTPVFGDIKRAILRPFLHHVGEFNKVFKGKSFKDQAVLYAQPHVEQRKLMWSSSPLECDATRDPLKASFTSLRRRVINDYVNKSNIALYKASGGQIDRFGHLLDADGRHLDADGHLLDAYGRPLDAVAKISDKAKSWLGRNRILGRTRVVVNLDTSVVKEWLRMAHEDPEEPILKQNIFLHLIKGAECGGARVAWSEGQKPQTTTTRVANPNASHDQGILETVGSQWLNPSPYNYLANKKHTTVTNTLQFHTPYPVSRRVREYARDLRENFRFTRVENLVQAYIHEANPDDFREAYTALSRNEQELFVTEVIAYPLRKDLIKVLEEESMDIVQEVGRRQV